jgi:opacity protein-like surface antigen
MKNRSNRSKIYIMLAAGLVSAWSGAAADMGSDSGAGSNTNTSGFYESADGGVAFMQKMTFHGTAFHGSALEFHTGPRFDLSLGYNLTRNVAVEVQGGFAYNNAKFTDSFMPSIAPDIWTVPVMVNGIYKHSFNGHWQAYGGAGAGAVFSSLGFSSSGETTDSTDTEFGYHAMAGIKYHFNDRWEAGLGYNFLGSLNHHWSQSQGITTDPTYQHSVLLSLTYNF